MLSANHFKAAIRKLLRNRSFTLINLLGLTAGLSCFAFIYLYVSKELSYDAEWQDTDRIYRSAMIFDKQDGPMELATSSYPLYNMLDEQIVGIETATRLLKQAKVIQYQDDTFREEHFFYADSTVLDIFSFQLISGNAASVLSKPNELLISEEIARKWFGSKEALGHSVRIEEEDYRVSGVFKQITTPTHTPVDVIASMQTLGDQYQSQWLSRISFYTYLKAEEKVDLAELEQQISQMLMSNTANDLEAVGWEASVRLQPIQDIHLKSNLLFELGPGGNLTSVYLLSVLGIFILLIACINFINLTTAMSGKYARETGMRKVLGAHTGSLIKRYLGESVLLSLLAGLITILIIGSLKNFFSQLTGVSFDFNLATDWPLLLLFSALLFVVGTLAGMYPAFVLTRFTPVKVLKGASKSPTRALNLRRGLVIFQFLITIVLISATLIIYQQMNYVSKKELGFSKERVVILPLSTAEQKQHYQRIKEKMKQNTQVLNTSASFSEPGGMMDGILISVEGRARQESQSVATLYADDEYLDTYEIPLLAGRYYDAERSDDAKGQTMVVNEAFVKSYGWTLEEAIGKGIYMSNDPIEIIGIVKDFHFASLHDAIAPLMIRYGPYAFQQIAVRLAPGSISTQLEMLEHDWKAATSGALFDYRFLDESFAQLYEQDRVIMRLFTIFSGLAILIACLGLFGLSAFMAQRRTKEIGIRKVLGASTLQLMRLLNREFVGLVLISFLIAMPLAYYGINEWLESFAYRVDFSWLVMLLAGSLAFIIALMVVSSQAYQTANANPTDSLRSD